MVEIRFDDDPGPLVRRKTSRKLPGKLRRNDPIFPADIVPLRNVSQRCDMVRGILRPIQRQHVVVRRPLVVISDVRMPAIDGLELLGRLQEIEELPLILMSGGSGIREAIDAFRLGVVDFLVKPFEMDAFLAAIGKGLAISAQAQVNKQGQSVLKARVSALTPREREVACQVALGRLNREIAGQLAMSERMVKMHRQNAMEKLQVKSAAGLGRIADQAGLL